ncbi:MAG: hypothetical protein CVU41_18195 [Chloroflexi bacterium HGW-Chloroflexi-3]|nr:MAG: hypothetical protein CVU41_18195 [Chloroflexi bacterium HGW-Chloroflexi-3]
MEESGIVTVVIATGVFSDRIKSMHLPRLVSTNFPMGRPLGAPLDREMQKEVLLSALDLIENANEAGVTTVFKGRYRPGNF